MGVKKKKKEPNSVMTNLNILVNKGFCAQTQSRVKNIFKALKDQLEPEEYEELQKLYVRIDADNPDSVDPANGGTYDHEVFAKYAKSLMHKYAKKGK